MTTMPLLPAPRVSSLLYRDSHGDERAVSLDSARDIPFEAGVPHRRIPHYARSTNTPGTFWAATGDRNLPYESWLEARWLIMLDYDHKVVALLTQPLQIRGLDGHGPLTHTPDIFARTLDGRARLIDVKPDHKHTDPEVRRRATLAAAACAELDWDYQLLGEPPTQRWSNIAWLAGYRRLFGGEQLIHPLLAAAHRPIRFVDLWSAAPPLPLAQTVSFHLCWRHRLVFDLDAPLRGNTLVRAAS